MKLIIAGSRDVRLTIIEIGEVLRERKVPVELVTEVVSGGAAGMDTCGEEWASYHGIPIKYFPANWDLHGKAAGPMRNKEMALYADAALIVMKKGGSPGSKNMKDHMFRMKKAVYVYEMEE